MHYTPEVDLVTLLREVCQPALAPCRPLVHQLRPGDRLRRQETEFGRLEQAAEVHRAEQVLADQVGVAEAKLLIKCLPQHAHQVVAFALASSNSQPAWSWLCIT